MAPQPKSGPKSISAYKAGGSKAKGEKPLAKLSSNENPLGASPKAIDAYTQASANLHRYPDPSASSLKEAIGEEYKLDASRIICGAGSDEIISLLCQAYAGEGDEVLYSQYGFLMYPIAAKAVGATPVIAEEKDHTTNVDNILEKASDKTKIVFVANPNNPTGTYLPKKELKRLRDGLPKDTLLVVDGAYAEYVDKADYTDGKELVDSGDNTVMTRTFSKIYGLAGLRVGWAYAPENVVDVYNKIRGPFNISSPAIAAATEAVKDSSYTKKVKEHNDVWLPRVTKDISQLGLKVTPSVGNFILVHFADESQAQAADNYLKEQDVVVRDMKSYDLGHALRISIGKEDENQRLVEGIKNFLGR